MQTLNRCLIATFGIASALTSTYVHAQDTGGGLEEIIITAEKREESLQKTPIAVTALDGDALVEAGVSQPEDLNKMVPGLGIAQGGPSTQVYVRGVGNYGTNAFADPAVAFNMDGVYISRFSGISGNFFDIQRMEVLKGPQGTLYGRNATGGAINIITNKPTQDFNASAGLELGSYSLRKVNGMVNVPVTSELAIRLSAQSTDRDGYQTDGYDDDVSRAARLHMLYKPADGVSLLVTGSYVHIGGQGPVHVPTNTSGFYDNSNPWIGLSQAIGKFLPVPAASPAPAALWQGVNRNDGKQDITVKGANVELNVDLGGAQLTTVLNHLRNMNDSRFYGPGFLVDTRTHSKQESLESRLSGNSNQLKWVGGLYFFSETQSENYWVDQGFIFNQTGLDASAIKDNTGAAFGQLTYSLTDALRLTGGLRYTDEKKSQDGQIFSRLPNGAANCAALNANLQQVFIDTVSAAIPQAATNGTGTAYPFPYCRDTLSGSTKWNDTSWKAGIDFDATETSMVYGSISRGFKAGGYFAGGDHAVVTLPDGSVKTGNGYKPETLLAYAIGSKNRFLNNRLQLNGEAFYWDYKDHQENYLAPTSNAGSFNFVTQQADAHIYGLDLELEALLTDNDDLNVKAEYLHARYTNATFINASPGPGNPPPVSVCSMAQNTSSPAIWYANCTGQQMPRSPNLAGSLDYRHTFHLSNGGMVVPSVNAQYSGSYWSAVDYNPLEKQDAYTMWGADLAYHAPDDAWSLTAWGANLGNEVIKTNAFMYPGNNSAAGQVAMVQLHAPRTYGVRFSAKF